MKYPFHTKSKPAVGASGKKVIEAVRDCKPIANDAAQATLCRIIEKRKGSTSATSCRKVQ